MIVVPSKEGGSIERTLRKFKRRFKKIGVVKGLRGRQVSEKLFATEREQTMCIIYVQHL